MAKYTCKKCGFTYDEDAASEEVFFEEIDGHLEEGVIDMAESADVFNEEINGVLTEGIIDHSEKCKALGFFPGTRWEDIPIDFKCPQCNADKDKFKFVAGF
jgi:rubredoxin